MYTLRDLKRAVSDPRVLAIEFNRVFHDGFRHRSPPYNQNGVDIPSADWDNLLILDACRYDTFKSHADDLPGKLTAVESRGSATRQFLNANFSQRDMTDTVYVTANPNLYKAEMEKSGEGTIGVEFYKEVNVWRNGWHEEYRTVMPEKVTEATLEAAENHPNKRLLVHYLQPHAPYIGPTGIENFPTSYLNFWGKFQEGIVDVDMETVRKAYRENLELVLPYVKEVMERMEGKTIVTSDHGELFGERDSPIPIKRYGHPNMNTHIPELVTVPWLVSQNGERRKIIAEEPINQTTSHPEAGESVEQRLEDLGYAQ